MDTAKRAAPNAPAVTMATVECTWAILHADGPTCGGSRYGGRTNGKRGSREIEARRRGAQSAMQIAAGRAAMPAGGAVRSDHRSDQRSERDQTEPLMDHQHVRPPIESRLIHDTSLRLRGGKAQIP
jgi:hypothetical protein